MKEDTEKKNNESEIIFDWLFKNKTFKICIILLEDSVYYQLRKKSFQWAQFLKP